jgi:hypothetical protein
MRKVETVMTRKCDVCGKVQSNAGQKPNQLNVFAEWICCPSYHPEIDDTDICGQACLEQYKVIKDNKLLHTILGTSWE